MVEEVILNWNIRCNPVPIYHTAWDVDNRYILKVYKDLVALERNILMMKLLGEAGIPVPKLIALPNGSDYYVKDDSYYILTTKLHGTNIVKLSDQTEEWFYQFGIILGELHLAFQTFEGRINYWNNSMLEEMKGWVSVNLNKFNREWLDLKDLKDTVTELEVLYDALPKQLIHRDVHLGNFLFDGACFSGYIDFDLSQSNIRIFDLCYFLLGILLEEDNRVEVKKWYDVVNRVVKGYSSKLPLSAVEKRAVPCVMKSIELLFVAYFLREGNENLAKGAAELFYFVKAEEAKIWEAVN